MLLNLTIKPIFVISILILSIATTGLSQENDTTQVKNIYKIGASKLLVKQFFLGYERIVLNHFSLNAQVGYLEKAFYLETLSDLNGNSYIGTEKTPRDQFINRRTSTKLGYQINLEFRWYAYGFKKAFFIGARGGYQYANFGDNLEVIFYEDVLGERLNSKFLDAQQNSYLYGGTLGWNLILGKKTALEFYILVGRRHSELTDPQPFVPDPDLPIIYFKEFKKNHSKPVDRMHFELGIYLGIAQ